MLLREKNLAGGGEGARPLNTALNATTEYWACGRRQEKNKATFRRSHLALTCTASAVTRIAADDCQRCHDVSPAAMPPIG